MTLSEAILNRHSVRAYTNQLVDGETAKTLFDFIEKCNKESGLNMQLIINEEKAFDCLLSHYGKFSGVKNYIAIVADKSKSVYEKIGYYGEKVVLFAQTIGLNTCWVALTYKKIKNKINVGKGKKIHVVISVGYGSSQGKSRKSKKIDEVCAIDENTPKWFINGVESALLAPTAMNQQKFFFSQKDGIVSAKAKRGFYSKIDLGIAKYHFEIGAGVNNFKWEL